VCASSSSSKKLGKRRGSLDQASALIDYRPWSYVSGYRKIGWDRDIKLSNVDLQKRETGAINIICGIVSRDSVIEQVASSEF
jgi:hypothetical protein